MSDFSQYREKVAAFGKKAYDAEEAKDYEGAYDYLMQAINIFMHMMKCKLSEFIKIVADEKNPKLIEIYKQKCGEYMERAEYLKKTVLSKKNDSESTGGGSAAKKKPEGGEGGDGNEENKKLQDALSGAIVKEKPNVKWSDVAGLDQAKANLQEAVILPTRFPQLFTGERKPWRGILLYGPPGTGKSYLAKACATEADGTFFSVSSSDLVSKWLGESERLVKQLFEMARESKPAIIFIDEVDSLCGSRSEGENETSRRVKTEFLVQMNGVGNDVEGILVLGATNVPWELDSAIRRRFEKRIYIPLPDPAARTYMFKIRLGKTPHSCSDEDFQQFGEMTEGYSGSDITILVKEAMMMPVRRCQTATRFKKTPDGLFEPTFPSDPMGVDMTLMDMDPSQLKPPDINADDFFKAINKIKPSVCAADLEQQIKFTNDFGQDG